MTTDLFERFDVIDVDTHLTEPPDVWTSRVASKWGDRIPHVERVDGIDLWMADGKRIGAPGPSAMAGWDALPPWGPPTFDRIPPSAYDAAARLALMDDLGIHAQVLYPNVGGFGNGYFLRLGDRELVAECVRAYNDFLSDFCATDPARLVPVTAVPFWDVEFAVAEIERCLANGHRAINFCNQPDSYGEPVLGNSHWDPIWAVAQEAGVPVCFHIGGGDITRSIDDPGGIGWQSNFARASSLIILDNQRCLADLVFGGVCHRFPRLRFVSVESGVGWIPAILETFDWQFANGGVHTEHPEYDLMPSEYFRRQIYGCFWFESAAARWAIERYPDNILYETDYPHPTCQYPGPQTSARYPREFANDALAGLDDAVLAKVLHDTAASLYGLG
jgi:predicted TIM-barrel fold metal-dependent hydrolase